MLDQQYSKYEYKDLNKGMQFVSTPSTPAASAFKQDNIIDKAVSEHLVDNFAPEDAGSMLDIKTHKVVEEDVPDVELSEIKTHSFSEDGQMLEEVAPMPKQEVAAPAIPEMDMEKIKEESYQKGYKEAEALFAPKIEAQQADESLHKLLQDKLTAIDSDKDLNSEIFEAGSGLIAILAKKLHLSVPADFEAIILGEMVPVLNKYHKKGKVIVRVNPERVDYCNNLFRIGELPEALLENIELVSDETVAANDCSIDWQDATLEYNQEDLLTEADNILEHLKMKIEN